ncbi:MAG: TetR/AcrR family transcriptional regulator [Bacillota bacterium]
MPRETFFNLKEEKQQRILNAALREIAAQGYDKASVTRIVKDAGIATGSFYQYFEDMADLFVYIGQEAARLKAQYMRRELEKDTQHSLEGFIRAMYRGGLQFGLEHKEYFRAAQSFLQIKDTELYRRMVANVDKTDLFVWLYTFVSQAIANGDLPAGITPELFFRLVSNINTTIIEYLLAAKPGGGMNMDDLETLCELGVQILLYGIQKPKT